MKTSIEPIIACLPELGVIELGEVLAKEVNKYCKVFINGSWIGLHNEPLNLHRNLLIMRRKGLINIYTSISWNIKMREIRIDTSAGRVCRPLYIVNNEKNNEKNNENGNNMGKLLIAEMVADIKNGKLNWNDLLVNVDGGKQKCCIEYLDTEEEDTSMIAMTHRDLELNNRDNEYYYNYTHCEIHPSMMLGVLAVNIPFPDFNQAPRNQFREQWQNRL